MIDIDVTEALDEYFASLTTDRGDEKFAHISDMAGPCDRATWLRRRGEKPMPWSVTTLAKFAMGRDVEAHVFKALEAKFPGQLYDDVLVIWNPAPGGGPAHLPESSVLDLSDEDARCLIIGHLDGLLRNPVPQHIFEAKSTSFLHGKIPTQPADHYAEQLAGYVAAMGVDGTLIVVCRESGKRVSFEIKCDEVLKNWARDRAMEVLEVTHPDAPMPPAEPRTSWACKTCRFAQCERNPAHAELAAK